MSPFLSDLNPECQSLDEVLRRELALLVQLHRCVCDERAALEGRDTDVLEQITARKGVLLEELAELDRSRLVLFAPLVTLDQSSEVDPGQPFSPEQHGLWQSILEITQRIAEMTRMNGILVTAGLGYCRQALAILSGRSEILLEYDASGQPLAHSGSRAIGCA